MNQTQLISDAQVRSAVTIPALIPVMRQAFEDLAAGRGRLLPRSALFQENRNILAVMAASLPRYGVCGCKTAIFPGPAAAGAGTAQSAVLLFDIETGALRSIVSAEFITTARTAAASAAATQVLARPDASVLCLLGAGAQAMAHAAAIGAIRPIREIRVWDIDCARAESACARLREEHPGTAVLRHDTAEGAVIGADVICTVTKASEPILFGPWLSSGAHVNAVGACSPFARELDCSVLDRARVYLDQIEATLGATGDLAIPMREGAFSREQIAGEIGAVFAGQCAGRAEGDRETVTLFESCGLAVQDVAAAWLAASGLRDTAAFSF